jgi:hypothetical protein
MNVNLHIKGIEVQHEQIKVGQFSSRRKLLDVFVNIWNNQIGKTIIMKSHLSSLQFNQLFPNECMDAKISLRELVMKKPMRVQ